MPRRLTRVGAPQRARRVLVALAFGAVVASTGAAFAQTSPPPASQPPAATPPAVQTPGASPPPAGAAPVVAPSLEAGDTAPPGAASVQTLDPMHAPPLPPAAPPTTATGATSPLVAPVPPARRPLPFYRKEWFWGAVAVVVVTGVVVTVLTVGTGDPATPVTKLGDMHAF